MVHPHLKVLLKEFAAVIHRTKNRLISVPADVQRSLGLTRRTDNHIVLASIRERSRGRWNHHYFKLTRDNEFAIPNDIAHLKPGQKVDVRIHRVIPDLPVANTFKAPRGVGLLSSLAKRPRPGWRRDGADRLDDYLRARMRRTGTEEPWRAIR
jgi:hypothetical protein